MILKKNFLAGLAFGIVSSAFATFALVRKPHSIDSSTVLGQVDGKPVVREALTDAERLRLFESEATVAKTADNILGKRFLETFFEDYKTKNKLNDIAAAREHFFANAAQISENEVELLLVQNKDKPPLVNLSAPEQRTMILDYLKKRRDQDAVQNLVAEALQTGRISSRLKYEEPKIRFDPKLSHSLAGADTASVTLVEFADYQCPACAQIAPMVREVVDEFKEKVQWRFIDFPLTEIHPLAVGAAVAARCAGEQGKYQPMHDKLMSSWNALSEKLYTGAVAALSLNTGLFQACLANPATREAVMESRQFAQELELSGTPTFFLNGKRVSFGDADSLRKMFQNELSSM